MKMNTIYAWIFLLVVFSYCDGKYQGIEMGYTEIPHSAINASETHIYLTRNNIEHIPSGALSNYTDLRVFTLGYNGLETVHEDAFNGTKLEILILNANKLDQIPNLMSVADSLVDLNLAGNAICTLDPYKLAPLVNLVKLHLQLNCLTQLPDEIFHTNVQLHELYLTHNQITQVHENAFAGLRLLSVLGLSHNDITSLPSDVLTPLSGLARLHISDNPLAVWPEIPAGLDLKLYASGIEQVEELPQSICNARLVSMSHEPSGKLPSIHCPLNETSKLYFLLLSNRKLNDSTDFYAMTPPSALEKLVLSNNEFTSFPDFPLSIRSTLRFLWLETCNIESINETHLHGFTKLEELTLSHNPLVTLPIDVFSLTKRLILRNVLSLSFEQTLWQDYLCAFTEGSGIILDGSMNTVAAFPDLTNMLCRRERPLTISLLQMDVPCDCSIGWMGEAADCGITLELDTLPCGYPTLANIKDMECPANYIMTCTGANFTGACSDMSMDRVENNTIGSLIIRGSKVLCVQQPCSANRLTAGAYPNAADYFNDHSSIIISRGYDAELPANLNSTSLLPRCYQADSTNAFNDGDLTTCYAIQYTSRRFKLRVRKPQPVINVTVYTYGLECEHRFHTQVFSTTSHGRQCSFPEACVLGAVEKWRPQGEGVGAQGTAGAGATDGSNGTEGKDGTEGKQGSGGIGGAEGTGQQCTFTCSSICAEFDAQCLAMETIDVKISSIGLAYICEVELYWVN